MRHALAAALAATLLLAACGEGEEGGMDMMPGANCLASGCHSGGEHAFGAAGTVFATAAGGAGVAGVTVTLRAGTVTLTRVTSAAGNFAFPANLPASFDVELSKGGATRTMAGATGACNDCHVVGGQGRIPAP